MTSFKVARRRVLQTAGLGAGAAALAACTDGSDTGTTGGHTGWPAPPTEFPNAFPEIPAAVPADSYAYDDMTDKVSISLMTVGAFNGPRPKDPVRDYLQKQFNADLTFTSLTADDMRNKLALSFTGGDAPDFINIPSGLVDIARTLYDQGQLLQADDILGLMPQLSKYVTKGFKAWATADDEMIGIPIYPTFPDNWNLFARKDFLAKMGLSLPTTTDELMTYAESLKEKDPLPDKAGPWFMATGGGGTSWSMMGQLQSAFGHPSWNVKDGKVNHPMLDGTTKAFLSFVNDLRSKDLLPPDWYTTQWEQLKSRTFNNQLGMVQYPGWNLATETYTAQKTKAAVEAWEPMGQLSSATNPEGLLPPGSGPGGVFVFNAKLADDEKKLLRIAHMIDTMIYPNTNYWAVSQGGGTEIWGDKVTVKFDKATGKNVFTIPPDAPYNTDKNLASVADWQFFGYTLIWQIYEDEIGSIGSEWNDETLKLKRWENFDIQVKLDPKPVEDLRALADKSEIQFALGKRSFDEWDAYVAEWRKSGGDELIKSVAQQLNAAES